MFATRRDYLPRRLYIVAAFTTVIALGFFAAQSPRSKDAPVVLAFGQESAYTDSRYTYIDGDYPQQWPLPLDAVHLSWEGDSVHYAINTPTGIAEWNSTLPSGSAIVHLGQSRRPFTVGMFHELRCLNILRDIFVTFYADSSGSSEYARPALAKHCMNYLRQKVLCRADLRLESVRSPTGSRKAVSDVTHTCRDWSAVYDAAEKNLKEQAP